MNSSRITEDASQEPNTDINSQPHSSQSSCSTQSMQANQPTTNSPTNSTNTQKKHSKKKVKKQKGCSALEEYYKNLQRSSESTSEESQPEDQELEEKTLLKISSAPAINLQLFPDSHEESSPEEPGWSPKNIIKKVHTRSQVAQILISILDYVPGKVLFQDNNSVIIDDTCNKMRLSLEQSSDDEHIDYSPSYRQNVLKWFKARKSSQISKIFRPKR